MHLADHHTLHWILKPAPGMLGLSHIPLNIPDNIVYTPPSLSQLDFNNLLVKVHQEALGVITPMSLLKWTECYVCHCFK
jgi:hypothetical protein